MKYYIKFLSAYAKPKPNWEGLSFENTKDIKFSMGELIKLNEEYFDIAVSGIHIEHNEEKLTKFYDVYFLENSTE